MEQALITTRRVITLAMSVGALLALALAAAPGSSARVANDPCPDDSRPLLICADRTEVPAGQTAKIQASRCGHADRSPTGMAGIPFSKFSGIHDPYKAEWDFWAENGQWVTWGGTGEFTSVRRDINEYFATSYSPLLHNWWIGRSWPVRVYQRCAVVGNGNRVAAGDPNSSGNGPAGDFDPAGAGSDTEHGGTGVDEILGGHGADILHGGPADDELLGGPGDDVAHGGTGSDELFDDQGTDHLDGGPGNDRFSAFDGDADEIACGAGHDVVVADPFDAVHGCEQVFSSAADAPAQPPDN